MTDLRNETDLDELSDEELMLVYQAGNALAFERLFKRHSKKVFSFLRGRLSRREEAEEVFQQVFSKLHRSRNSYSREYAFTQWLFVVVKTVLVDHWNRENAKERKLSMYKEEVRLMSAQRKFVLEVALPGPIQATLADLPSDQKQALQWRVMDDLPYDEIAKRLNSSQTNARQLVSRALKKLKHSHGKKGGST